MRMMAFRAQEEEPAPWATRPISIGVACRRRSGTCASGSCRSAAIRVMPARPRAATSPAAPASRPAATARSPGRPWLPASKPASSASAPSAPSLDAIDPWSSASLATRTFSIHTLSGSRRDRLSDHFLTELPFIGDQGRMSGGSPLNSTRTAKGKWEGVASRARSNHRPAARIAP